MKKLLIVPILCAAFAANALAEVQVDEPWARATVAAQRSSGAFMTLTSTRDARLVEVRSPSAGLVEIHEMALENNVMRMRAIEGGLALPAGKAVTLRPGGHHLMMMELKAPLKAGEQVPLTLVIEDADGSRENVEVRAPIRPLAPAHDSHGARHGH